MHVKEKVKVLPLSQFPVPPPQRKQYGGILLQTLLMYIYFLPLYLFFHEALMEVWLGEETGWPAAGGVKEKRTWVMLLMNYLRESLYVMISLRHNSLFLKILFFLERGREGEREGETHQCVVASHAPPTGIWPATPGVCPKNATGNPLVHRPVLNPLSHTSQGSISVILLCKYKSC